MYLPKHHQHEQVAGEVLPVGVAEGGGQELPPVRRAVPQVQRLNGWHVEHGVRQENAQVDHEQQEDARARAGAGSLCRAAPCQHHQQALMCQASAQAMCGLGAMDAGRSPELRALSDESTAQQVLEPLDALLGIPLLTPCLRMCRPGGAKAGEEQLQAAARCAGCCPGIPSGQTVVKG